MVMKKYTKFTMKMKKLKVKKWGENVKGINKGKILRNKLRKLIHLKRLIVDNVIQIAEYPNNIY